MLAFVTRAGIALSACLLAGTAMAATITATSELRANWLRAGTSISLQGSPVTLEIEFDETHVGTSIAGTGFIDIAGARQAAVSASISFTSIAGSGSANGDVLSIGVVLDNQPYVDRSFFANGRFIRVFVDENPDQLPLSVDINSFAINLYGSRPVGVGTTLPIGDAIAQFIATPRQAGQRVVFYPSQVQSFIWGPNDIARVSLRTAQPPTSVPHPAPLALLALAVGLVAGVRRRSVSTRAAARV